MRAEYLPDDPVIIETLARWHYQQWGYMNLGDSVAARMAMLRTHLGSEKIPITFVALSGAQVLGSASLVQHDMDTRRDLSPWLASVYVHTVFRGNGIGTALVCRAVDEARSLLFRTLYLFTPDRVPFYARLGWSVIQQTNYRGKNVAVMMKLL